jgi:hypothetical protein
MAPHALASSVEDVIVAHRRRYSATAKQRLVDPARWNCLQFVKNLRSFHLHHRGAFWRLLAALQIQLNRSPSSTPARQRFSLAGLFRFLLSPSRTTAPPYHVAI